MWTNITTFPPISTIFQTDEIAQNIWFNNWIAICRLLSSHTNEKKNYLTKINPCAYDIYLCTVCVFGARKETSELYIFYRPRTSIKFIVLVSKLTCGGGGDELVSVCHGDVHVSFVYSQDEIKGEALPPHNLSIYAVNYVLR